MTCPSSHYASSHDADYADLTAHRLETPFHTKAPHDQTHDTECSSKRAGFMPPHHVYLHDCSAAALCDNADGLPHPASLPKGSDGSTTANRRSLSPTIRFLLDDLADASCAYARVSHSDAPVFVRNWHLDEQMDLRANSDARNATDALVFGFALDDIPTALPQTRVRIAYALIACPDYKPDEEDIAAAVAACEALCQAADTVWGGALVMRGAGIVMRTYRDPRMGRTRETHSLAIDQLVGAVRLGMTVAQAAQLNGNSQGSAAFTNRIVAAAPVSKLRYRLLCRKDA